MGRYLPFVEGRLTQECASQSIASKIVVPCSFELFILCWINYGKKIGVPDWRDSVGGDTNAIDLMGGNMQKAEKIEGWSNRGTFVVLQNRTNKAITAAL